MKLLSERLNWALDRAGKIPAELARMCRSSDAAVSNWLSDTNGMSAQKARLAGAFLGVNPYWLETGEGEPLGSASEAEGQVPRDELTDGIIEALRRLPPAKRQRVADFVAGVEAGLLKEAAESSRATSAPKAAKPKNVTGSTKDPFLQHQPDPSVNKMYRGVKDATEGKRPAKSRRTTGH